MCSATIATASRQCNILLLTCYAHCCTTLLHTVLHAHAHYRDCQQNGWLLDGFPRNPEQARMLTTEGLVPDCIVVLDRPDELVREFTLGRMSDSSTGITYHPKVHTYYILHAMSYTIRYCILHMLYKWVFFHSSFVECSDHVVCETLLYI
jgi:Adenylate kinase